MPLLEPITFVSAPLRQADTRPVITEKAEDLLSCLFSPSPDVPSVMSRPRSLMISSGINSRSRSDPPTPPRGPPSTPRRRGHNELSKSDPPTPPSGPPPTPRRRDEDMFNSLSRRDLSNHPNDSPLTPRHYGTSKFDSLPRRDSFSPSGGSPIFSRSDDYNIFNSLSRRDPPTPPRGPPPSPSRRGIFNDLSRRDPPSPPRGPPPSPRRHDVNTHTSLSRSDPPSPPRGPPPTPGNKFSGCNAWTVDETNLLMFVCKSGVKLGWYQIAGLFHGKDVDACRSMYREIQCLEEALLGSQKQSIGSSNDSKSCCEPLQLCIPTDDPVPGLSRGPSPVGSPVYERLTLKSWELGGDVECAVDFEMPKTKTIAHLSDELNFVLEKDWGNVTDRVQDQHAFSHAEESWRMARSFSQMAD